MDAMTENTIRQEQVKSFGQLMAGFSHDMKNHLGIIRESNGLMSDIIAMSGPGGDEASTERLKKAISSIERRVVVAANMLHHLSGFAHRPDTPYSSFQINDLITEECIFLERYTRIKQVSLALELGEGLPAIYNDPSLLQHVFYRLFILCLEQLGSGQRLIIITGQNNKNTEITFRLFGAPQVNHEKLSDSNLLAAITKLKGKLEAGATTQDYADITLAIANAPVAI